MDPLTIPLVLAALKFFVLPIAEKARDSFAQRIGEPLGEGAADVVIGWINEAVGAPGQQSTVIDQMTAEPTITAGVRTQLGAVLGIELAPTSGDGVAGGVGAMTVNAYEAILWRIAAMAHTEMRPIAIVGAFQGPEWVTVCEPTYPTRDHSKDLDIPPPRHLWVRMDPATLRRHEDNIVRSADFYVRKTGDGDAETQVRDLNREFVNLRRFRHDDKSQPLERRWHRVDGVQPLWVQLAPDREIEQAVTSGPNGREWRSLRAIGIGYDAYPQPWRPLIDIPSEAEALGALVVGTDRFALRNAEIATAIDGLLRRTDPS